jgi:hypothetical protein
VADGEASPSGLLLTPISQVGIHHSRVEWLDAEPLLRRVVRRCGIFSDLRNIARPFILACGGELTLQDVARGRRGTPTCSQT